MTELRPLSPRPEFLVGSDAALIGDSAGTQVGTPGPLGRARVVYALPLNKDVPVQLRFMRAVQTNDALLADPQGNIVGDVEPVYVARLLFATPSENTRR